MMIRANRQAMEELIMHLLSNKLHIEVTQTLGLIIDSTELKFKIIERFLGLI
jgi:hypothetical protein